MAKVSFCIITHNTRDFLRDCLDSIYKNVKGVGFEIFVLDNASTDGTSEMLKSDYPGVELIVNDKNMACGGVARNTLLKRVTTDYAVNLDSDTIVHENAMEHLVRFAEDHGEAGIICPRLQYLDGSHQYSVRRFPGPIELICRRLEGKFSKSERMKRYYFLDRDLTQVQEVDYGIGACHFIRMKALREIGMYDEKIFYGTEDMEVCARMKKAGHKVIYVPEATITHREQRISKKGIFKSARNFRLFFHLVKSNIYVQLKYGFFRAVPRVP